MRSFDFRDENGFTLQEILVVMLVSSLLVSLCLSLFLFSNKLFKGWERKTELTGAVERAAYSMAMDVHRARAIVSLSDSALVLDKGSNVQTTYRFVGGSVLRDGINIIADSAVLVTINLERLVNMGSMRYRIEGNRRGALKVASGFVSTKMSSKLRFKENIVENP